MSALNHKIDFALVFTVRNANPNGDPIDGNRPRTTYAGLGEVSDVCLKRKMCNRWMDEGYSVFVQSDDRRVDEHRSLKARADAVEALKEIAAKKTKKGKKKDAEAGDTSEDYKRIACEEWLDVRAFGQLFAFKKSNKNSKNKSGEEMLGEEMQSNENSEEKGSDAVSVGVRGPVSIQSAFSVNPVSVTSLQITKSVNLETADDPDQKGSDAMGYKHRVDFGTYVTYGSINVQMAQKTGFSEEDAEALKEALRTIFMNDASSARPDGSMEVIRLVWWEHNCASGQYSAAKVHRSLRVTENGTEIPKVSVEEDKIPGLRYELIEGA